MVIDFSRVKQIVQEECALLDHKILVPIQSPFLEIMNTEISVTLKSKTKKYIFPRGDCVLLDIGAVTSELLAAYFWRRLAPKLADTEFSILIEETPGSIAKYGTL
jgi:6-pyruvoyltetrahydropterin/6-carboxytetrahydropterin synthase